MPSGHDVIQRDYVIAGIKPINPRDSGIIQCVAENQAGVTTAATTLKVKPCKCHSVFIPLAWKAVGAYCNCQFLLCEYVYVCIYVCSSLVNVSLFWSPLKVEVQLQPNLGQRCNRVFSCDVISSWFCKSSHLRPPCWFPLRMVRYRKTQENVKTFEFIPQYQNNIEWVSDKNNYTHLVEILISVMKEFKNKRMFCCFSQYWPKQRGNHGAGQNRACLGVYRIVQTLYRGSFIC